MNEDYHKYTRKIQHLNSGLTTKRKKEIRIVAPKKSNIDLQRFGNKSPSYQTINEPFSQLDSNPTLEDEKSNGPSTLDQKEVKNPGKSSLFA